MTVTCSRPAGYFSDGDGGGVKACVVIPIFDHKDTIEDVIAGLRYLGLSCFVVNDGSSHDTRQVLDRLPTNFPWVEVLHLPVNRGRGAALQHGYRAAAQRGFSHVLQLDADGQHDPADAVKLLDAARRHPDALVLGEPVFDETAPKSRRYGRRLSQMIVWCYTASIAIHDPLCGFRCFPLESTLRVMKNHRVGDRMEFDPEIVVRLAWYGVRIINVPTRVKYFPAGLSHFRFFRDNVLIAAAYARLLNAVLTGARSSGRPGRSR
jgi:glycosyltransferase involved in cell wall biosynthesis